MDSNTSPIRAENSTKIGTLFLKHAEILMVKDWHRQKAHRFSAQWAFFENDGLMSKLSHMPKSMRLTYIRVQICIEVIGHRILNFGLNLGGRGWTYEVGL